MKYMLLLTIDLVVGTSGHAFAQYEILTPTVPVSGLRVVAIREHPVDVKLILEEGQRVGKLPKNVVIRVAASISSTEDEKHNLKEAWEFSDGQVHKIEYIRPTQTNKAGYKRLKSLPFDTKNLCEEVIEGDAFEIEAGDDTTETAQFVGTKCKIGFRRITVLVDGQPELELGESCLFPGYGKTLAKKFAALYEQLAQQARKEFKVKK